MPSDTYDETHSNSATRPLSAGDPSAVVLHISRVTPFERRFANRTLANLLGYSAEAEAAMGPDVVPVLMHPDDRVRFDEHLARLHGLKDGATASFLHRMRAATGEWRWLDARAAVLTRADDGMALEFIGSVRDVTAQVETEDSLRASEARHRLLAETMLQGVVHHNADGSIIALNPAAERILGRTRDSYLGSDPIREQRNTIREDGSPFPGDEHPSAVALRTGEPVHGVVMGVFNWDRREYRWISVDAVPLLRLGERTPYEVYTVFEDITDRLRAEQALREAHTRKDQFIATLAHELRNPLAPIRNAVAVQQRRVGNDPELAWSQAIIERQVSHMARLLDDLLDASRIASGKLELRREQVRISDLVAQSIETARPLIDAARHQLTVAIPDDSLTVDGDPIRLAQVVSNLLTNAAKYTEPGGRIDVRADRDGDDVVLRVRDNGIGIAAEHLQGVFEMFGQVQSAIDRSQGGLGIGLSLARALVEMHEGRISAHSEGAGAGTEFVVRLPATRETLVVATPAEVPASGAVPSRRRVLVIDDNRDGCDSLAAVLELFGYDVASAYDGAGGIALVETYQPAVVLLDVGLPGLNGYETCRSLRATAAGESLVILAATGWGTDADLRRAIDAGFDAHLVKPIDMEHLVQLLPLSREAVRAAHQKHQLRNGRVFGWS